jgi:LacI family transcriptional regulator
MAYSKRATIKTIAKEANLTANTVSLALRDSPLVKPETKQLIIEIAERQGYVPNVTAESLRLGHSKLIALIFGDIGNPLFAIKTKKIEDALRKCGYQVMIMDTDEDLQQEIAVVRSAIGRKVDGVVLCPCQKGREALDLMKQHKVPCVLVGRSMEDGLEDSVVWDNYRGGQVATEHLISLGCKRILCLLGPKEISTSHERQAGYQAALREANLPVLDELQIRVERDRVVDALKKQREPFDGIFAFSDLYAWEAAACLQKEVPIIGYDNVKSSLTLPFSIPTVAADLDKETEYIVDFLLKRIEEFDRPVSKKTLPVNVVL